MAHVPAVRGLDSEKTKDNTVVPTCNDKLNDIPKKKRKKIERLETSIPFGSKASDNLKNPSTQPAIVLVLE